MRPLTTFDIVACELCNLSHHLEHSLDDVLQDFCLFTNDIVRDLLSQRQYALQSIQERRRHLVIFVLFLQELDSRALALFLIR